MYTLQSWYLAENPLVGPSTYAHKCEASNGALDRLSLLADHFSHLLECIIQTLQATTCINEKALLRN